MLIKKNKCIPSKILIWTFLMFSWNSLYERNIFKMKLGFFIDSVFLGGGLQFYFEFDVLLPFFNCFK